MFANAIEKAVELEVEPTEIDLSSGTNSSSSSRNNHNNTEYIHHSNALTSRIADAFAKEPVPESAFKGWFETIGLFASRHTAGTEFAVGPLFAARGATAIDVVLGLLIGNFLATLSWRYVCAPIAVRTRLTAYCSMERVVGRKLMYAYDLLAGLSLALIGGAMFTVSATAVGAIFDVEMPGLNDWLPTSWAFTAVVFFCGAVTTIVATYGITFVTIFGTIVTPVLLAGIIYLGVQSLIMLGLGDGDDLWTILNEKVYDGVVVDDNFSRFGFAHCVFFAWFCDLQLHIGQNDLALLRYARHEGMGWSSAAGMYIGHYFAWIVAGCMYAVQLQEDPDNTSVAPGPIANMVGGTFGIIVVVIAGWSTANPIMYSAGLALQHAFPTMKASTSTLIIGSIATAAALFPGFTSRVLELVAYGGLILCPMGVILFADHWVLPRYLGIKSNMAAAGSAGGGIEETTNWPAVYSWVIAMIISLPLALFTVLEAFFTPLLTIILCFLLYVGFSYLLRQDGLDMEAEESADHNNKEEPPVTSGDFDA